MHKLPLIFCLPLLAFSAWAAADSTLVSSHIDARMMRQPDVSATQIAFVYAGEAVRLSSPRGEESFPKFSPDGSQLAFSGDYDGNLDIYVMPVIGGVPH